MNRHLIWIIAGTSMLGLGVPALAAARSDGSPDDNGVPGDVRGNCDEAEHANDPECLAVVVPGKGAVVVTVPSSTVTTPSTRRCRAVRASLRAPLPPASRFPRILPPIERCRVSPSRVWRTAGTDDVSGPCDEAEHAGDPRCTGIGDDGGADDDLDDDSSGPGGSVDDDIDDDSDDDDDDSDIDDDDSDDSGRQRHRRR